MLLVAALLGALFIYNKTLISPEQAAADARPPSASVLTSVVERRVLEEPVVIRASVEEGKGVPLLPPSSIIGSDAVVTDVFVKPGAVIEDGTLLAEVAGSPLWAFNFAFPLYRDISAGLQGPDVEQIQLALERVGIPTRKSGVFDYQTQSSIKTLYDHAGYVVTSNGGEANPDVVAKKTALESADPLVGDIPSLKKELTLARLSAGPVLTRSSFIRLDEPRRTVSDTGLAIGQVLSDPAMPIAILDAGPAVVSAVISDKSKAVVTVGQSGTLFDDVSGSTLPVTVKSVADQPSTDAAGAAGYLTTFGSADPGITGRSVRIVIVGGQSQSEVLVAPITSIFSEANGKTYVSVKNGSDFIDTEVTVVRAAGGYAELREPAPPAVVVGAVVVVGMTNG